MFKKIELTVFAAGKKYVPIHVATHLPAKEHLLLFVKFFDY